MISTLSFEVPADAGLVESLQARVSELEALNHTLTEDLDAIAFFASHDFQEPMVIQTMFLRILQQEVNHELSGDAQLAVEALQSSSDRMHKMVLAMLGYSRAGRGELHLERLDLDCLVGSVLYGLAERVRESGAAVMCDQLGSIMGDRKHLTQVFAHLIENALKFHRTEGTPRVVIGRELKAGNTVFHVRDSGIGIEAEHLPLVFRPFWRAVPKDSRSGPGVGLSICRKIVERHGGSIWIESAAGTGTKVSFTLGP